MINSMQIPRFSGGLILITMSIEYGVKHGVWRSLSTPKIEKMRDIHHVPRSPFGEFGKRAFYSESQLLGYRAV